MRLLPPSTIPLLQLRVMQEVKDNLVACRRIRRQGQAVASPGLEVHRQSRRGRVELLEGGKIVSVIAIASAEAIVLLSNDELNIRQVSICPILGDQSITYLDGSLERRGRVAKHSPEREELAHAVGLTNLPGVVEERGLKRPLLQKDELRVALGRLHNVPRAAVAKLLGVVLLGKLEPPRADAGAAQLAVVQEPGEDGAVAGRAVLGEQPDDDGGAEGVADLDDLGGLVVAEGGDTADLLGGADELSGAGEGGQLAQDFDLDAGCDDVVGVGLAGGAGADAVVREDGVPLGQGGVDVRVLAGLDLDVPVALVEADAVGGELEDVGPGALGRDAQLAADLEGLLDDDLAEDAGCCIGRAPRGHVIDPVHSIDCAVDFVLQPVGGFGVDRHGDFQLNAWPPVGPGG